MFSESSHSLHLIRKEQTEPPERSHPLHLIRKERAEPPEDDPPENPDQESNDPERSCLSRILPEPPVKDHAVPVTVHNIVHGVDRKDLPDRKIDHRLLIPQDRCDPETNLDQYIYEGIHIFEKYSDCCEKPRKPEAKCADRKRVIYDLKGIQRQPISVEQEHYKKENHKKDVDKER